MPQIARTARAVRPISYVVQVVEASSFLSYHLQLRSATPFQNHSANHSASPLRPVAGSNREFCREIHRPSEIRASIKEDIGHHSINLTAMA